MDLLCDACTRNIPAELHFEKGNASVVTVRSRFLGYEDDHLYLDAPSESRASWAASDGVRVHFQVDGARYSFETTLIECLRRWRLNDSQTVPAIVVRGPVEIHNIQRRRHFRVPVGGRFNIPVSLFSYGHELQGIPETSPLLHGRMLDLSEGGMRLVIKQRAVTEGSVGTLFHAVFSLPDEQTPISLPVEIRYSRQVPSSEQTKLGLMFLDTGGSLKAAVLRLNRFLHRAQLQPRKR